MDGTRFAFMCFAIFFMTLISVGVLKIHSVVEKILQALGG